MKDKRIFVSGAAGVIGQEMIPRLIALGATVLAGDLKPQPDNFPPQVQYRIGDLNLMTAAEWNGFAPDIFIHLAATFERSAESYPFWEENFLHNVGLSHHLMTLAKDAPSLKRVVFASSYLIYEPSLYQFGTPQAQPVSLTESDPIYPRNLTGAAKFAHEIELRFIDHFCSDRFTTVCARIYRGYGRNSRDVISRWIGELIKGETITLYRPEGMFDYIYAADSAEGLIRLANATSVTGIINLGTGRSRTVADVVKVLGTHFPAMQVNTVNSDIPFEASQADMRQYTDKVGWKPIYNIEKAIPEIIEFERQKLMAKITPTRRLKVLVSSAAAKIPLIRATQDAVRQFGTNVLVVAGDHNSLAIAAHVADEFWAMPPTNDEHLQDILVGLRVRGINCVLPTRDGELLFWARNKTRFASEGVAVIVSDAAAIELCIDKLSFANFGREKGFPFIATAEQIHAIDALYLVVKERHGSGSLSIGIKLDRKEAQKHAATLVQPIFQPMVEGYEISIDAWLDRAHKVKGLVLRKREQVVNGESRVTTTFSDVGIETTASRILEALELNGPVVMQAIIDTTGAMHVIECNPRFGGASTTGIAAGLASLHWSLLEILGCDLKVWPFRRCSGQIRQIRVPQDLYVAYPDL
jgi:carbamoyl-phosphate synthase large subunit